jgi:hypothetical protein
MGKLSETVTFTVCAAAVTLIASAIHTARNFFIVTSFVIIHNNWGHLGLSVTSVTKGVLLGGSALHTIMVNHRQRGNPMKLAQRVTQITPSATMAVSAPQMSSSVKG